MKRENNLLVVASWYCEGHDEMYVFREARRMGCTNFGGCVNVGTDFCVITSKAMTEMSYLSRTAWHCICLKSFLSRIVLAALILFVCFFNLINHCTQC